MERSATLRLGILRIDSRRYQSVRFSGSFSRLFTQSSVDRVARNGRDWEVDGRLYV